MRVAILNPGPSLNDTYAGRDGYDLTIGVNRAMLAFDLDWWVWMDTNPPMPNRVWDAPESEWKRKRPELAPHQFVTDAGERYLSQHDMPRDRRVWRFDTHQHAVPYKLKWHVYSATAAMALAYILGATHVDVYGADMQGVLDFDGTTHHRDNRDDKRWGRERDNWNETVAWMAFNGMAVRRVVPRGMYHQPLPEARNHGAA